MSTPARILLFLLEVFRPIFWLIGIILRFVYFVLLSWWFGPLVDRWVRNGFAQEVQERIPFLFERHGGKVVADPKSYTNDEYMDYLCVAAGDLILKFRRWHRENYGIQLAPTFAPTDSYDALDALLLVDSGVKIDRSALDTDWHHWGKLLEPRFQLLEQAFDTEHFAETKAALLSQKSSGARGPIPAQRT